jgi:hypothetical protein
VPSKKISLTRARAFRHTRYQNEIAHFASVYDNTLYDERDRRARGEGIAAPTQEGYPRPVGDPAQPKRRRACLRLRLPPSREHDPHAAAELRGSAESPLRWRCSPNGVSLCRDSADRSRSHPRSWRSGRSDLVDISDALLDKARSYMPRDVSLRALIQDVNRIDLEPDPFDVVACVSGIHHAIELEHVFSVARRALVASGELWLIGEQVGPSGNRLAPSDHAVANASFHASRGSCA